MARYNERDVAGRFVAIAAPPPEAQGTEIGETALSEFVVAVNAATGSLEALATSTAEKLSVEAQEKKQSFWSLGKGKLMFGALVAVGWKAVRWLDKWSKESAASVERMEKASKHFAAVIGRTTTGDRLKAAEDRFQAAEKGWKSAGGPTTREKLPWWAAWPGGLASLFGIETSSEKLQKSRLEMEGAKAMRDYLRQLNLTGERKASLMGFGDVGRLMQKELIERDALVDLTAEQLRVITQIEYNTSQQVSAVTR